MANTRDLVSTQLYSQHIRPISSNICMPPSQIASYNFLHRILFFNIWLTQKFGDGRPQIPDTTDSKRVGAMQIDQFQLSQQGNQSMYLPALTLSRFRVASTLKHPALRAKHELTRLFACKDTKRELSHQLKILPGYFSFEMLDQFCASPLHEQFCANNLQFQKESHDEEALKKYFSNSRMLRAINSQQSLQCLEVYLHWLLNHCESFSIHENNYILEMLNLERPDKWFHTKQYCERRTFIYHHGPTNSGKSTAAIQELRNLKGNERGIYMAPLRLLAWEYQQKLQNCSLLTGQEKEFKNSNLISCTIEAAPLSEEYEVAVIDQIQMIGDVDRGWAWTRAVLAVKAKRVHLCGDERALNIVSKLLELTGDILEQRKYSRLSKLTLIHKNFRLENISPGDCIINFSMNSLINHRNDINTFINSRQSQLDRHALNLSNQESAADSQVEDTTNSKSNHTAIVYGRLPPECRKSQAVMFNSRELPYLVATNAIGMGLNLNIRKIIFMSIQRNSSNGPEPLEDHQIQQIAGRAGRGKETGYVQCVSPFVLKKVKKALSKVNETYGIQLENIRDETNESEHAMDEDSQEDDKSQLYSNFLKRFLKEKQCRIKSACFYFQTDYIILFKIEHEQLLGKALSNIQVLTFLKTYCKLGDLYFMQEVKAMDYILTLLENQKMDQNELFIFCNGLNLSLPNAGTHKRIRGIMQNCHKQYIESFVKLRKVDLPDFLVKLHRENFQSFRYMDQIAELQFYFNLLETYVWLWGKFQFAFHEVKLAKQIKLALSEKINAVLLSNQFMREKKQGNSFQFAQKNHSAHQRRSLSKQTEKKEENNTRKQREGKKASTTETIVIKQNPNSFFKKEKKIKMQERKTQKEQNNQQSQATKQIDTRKILKRRKNKKKKTLFRLKFTLERRKCLLKNKNDIKNFRKILKKVSKRHPKLVRSVIKFSHRKKKIKQVIKVQQTV